MSKPAMAGAAILAHIFMAGAAVAHSVTAPPEPQNLTSDDITALADYQFPACYDSEGTAVRYIDTTNTDERVSPMVLTFGVRYMQTDPIGDPAIIYHSGHLTAMPQIARDFIIAHECYHFSSGDALAAYRHYEEHGRHWSRTQMQQFEDDADCAAAHQLRDEFGYNAADMNVLQTALQPFMTNRERVPRWQAIVACFEDGPKI